MLRSGKRIHRAIQFACQRFVLLFWFTLFCASTSADDTIVGVTWKDRMLRIEHRVSADPIEVNYLEAYCRPGSTDRDWGETVIPHGSKLQSISLDGKRLRVIDSLDDGVIVTHRIITHSDFVEIDVSAQNPTSRDSQVSWAQPCMRVASFAGARSDDFRAVHPDYIHRCFLMVDGKEARLPTTPWALKARYTPGQVYCPSAVDRNDVNPRPLSELVPSHGLAGCYSKDGKHVVAMAWSPYQEVFQGVVGCMHVDFRIGGVRAGESKRIRGAIYIVPADLQSLVKRVTSGS